MANETVALVRWIVPNYAVVDEPPRPRQDGLRPSKTIAIHDLSQSALDSLANDWLDDLYAKAGKPRPSTDVRKGD